MKTLHKIAVASLVIAMAGCGQKTTTEHLSDAKQLISEKNFSEATIALKNAAKNAPEDADVRLELASVYLKIGNIEAAEKELMMALDKGADINLVFPTLGHLLFLQNKLEDLESIDLEDVDVNPEVRDQIKFYQLYTLINRSLIDDALTLIAQPNASNSGYAQLIDALALYSKGDTDKSISLTNTLLEEDTNFNDARLVLVKLYTSNNEADKAESVLRVYNENVPYDYRSKLLHARVLIQINNLDDAKKKLTTLQSGRLYSPLQDQMLAQIHYLKGDFETAELNIQNALKNGLSDDFTNSLAGAIFLKTNKPEQALQRLSSVSEKGKTENNQQLLIMALVNVGKDKEAAQLLLEQEKVDDDMVSMMTLSANKLVNQGQSTLALETLLKATAVEDLNVTNAVNLGLLKLRLNDFSGLQDLKTIVEAHPSKAESRLGYVLGLMKARKIDSAKAELNQWLATPGISVNDELLIAKLMLKVNEPDSAIKTLTKLTTVDAVSRDAKIELVRLSRKSDLSQNVRFLSEILEQNPTDKLALQYLASNRDYIAQLNDAESLFIEASAAQDQHPEYVVLHSLFLMQELQPKKALQLLENIKNSPQLPDNYWPLFAELNLKLENFNEAIAGYENWSATEQNALASLRLVYLYQYSNRLDKALATAKLGTKRFNNVVFKYLTVDMLLNKANVPEAKQVFNSIQAGKYAEMVEWQTLKGRIAAIDGDFELALSTFKKVYDETHSPLLVKFITGVYRMTNNYPAATVFLESHLEMYPADLNTWQVKFNVEIQKDPLKAEYAALKITELAPNDSIAFNNLAWFELQNNKVALAAKHIEKAIELNNKNPELFDTASQIAMKQGNKTKAIEYIKSAITLAPNSATYRATLREIESK